MTQLIDRMVMDAQARLRVSIEANTNYQLKLMRAKWAPSTVEVPWGKTFKLTEVLARGLLITCTGVGGGGGKGGAMLMHSTGGVGGVSHA